MSNLCNAGNIEKRIVLNDATARVFQYAGEPQLDSALGAGPLEAHDVHRLIGANLQLEFETDQPAQMKQRHDVQLAMTWNYPTAGTLHLTLDGDHTYWSPC